MTITRHLNLNQKLSISSHLLLGPRQTGKSYLIHEQLESSACIIDLLATDQYLKLLAQPWLLESMIPKDAKLVVIDEIQKVPILLNEVHRLIERKKITFLLTGSSARSLRQKGVNLLAGRAWPIALHPLVSSEVKNFDLKKFLHIGGLPGIYLSQEPKLALQAYTQNYLKEEIQAESAVRNIPAFARFLQSAAISSGQLLNFSKIAHDAQVSPNTIREYYHILEDTLLGFLVPSWQKSQKRKAISTAKCYLFDVGVRNTLIGLTELTPGTDQYGQAFEHFIAQELRAYLSYHGYSQTLAFWQSKNGQEIDFIIGEQLAIEVKATQSLSKKHSKGLKALQEEGYGHRSIIVSHDKHSHHIDGIECWHWQAFCQALWHGEFL